MFKLPVCPYCHTVYRYKRVRKIDRKEKTIICYHCKKEFKVKRLKGTVVLGAIVLVLAVMTNLAILNSLENLNLTPLIVSTVAYVILGLILFPFFIDFKKIKKTEPSKEKQKSVNESKKK